MNVIGNRCSDDLQGALCDNTTATCDTSVYKPSYCW